MTLEDKIDLAREAARKIRQHEKGRISRRRYAQLANMSVSELEGYERRLLHKVDCLLNASLTEEDIKTLINH